MMSDINQFADTSKASVDTLFGLTGQAFQGVEQLVALNLQVIKTSAGRMRRELTQGCPGRRRARKNL